MLDVYYRTENFAVRTIQLIESLPYKKSVGIIGDQLMRSASSVGANLAEADNARSKREFVSILGICLKEIGESIFWIRLLSKTNRSIAKEAGLLFDEASQIKKIIAKIYNTARN